MRKSTRRYVALATCVLAALLAALLVRSLRYKPVSLTAEEEDIYEAVFRYQFEHSGDETLGDFFLLIDDRNPSEAFLKRFAEHRPPVRKGSEYRDDAGTQFTAAIVGRRNSKVVVVARYFMSTCRGEGSSFLRPSRCFGEDEYVLTRTSSGWIVTGTSNIMVTWFANRQMLSAKFAGEK